MKRLTFLFMLLAQPALGFEYLLSYERECSYKGPSFECKKSAERITIRQRPDGKWVGIDLPGREIELSVMKQDDYVLVLNNPVYFSGSSVVHIMKKTGRFYWSEFAYSEILKADEGHVRVGRFSLKTKQVQAPNLQLLWTSLERRAISLSCGGPPQGTTLGLMTYDRNVSPVGWYVGTYQAYKVWGRCLILHLVEHGK